MKMSEKTDKTSNKAMQSLRALEKEQSKRKKGVCKAIMKKKFPNLKKDVNM